MSKDLNIGQIITTHQERDAIHIAVAPAVVGSSSLMPAAHVKLSDGKLVSALSDESIGVIDPFLPVRAVMPGQKVWLFLHPGSITSLRHDWTHPAFKDDAANKMAESKNWLRKFSYVTGVSYEELTGRIADSLESNGSAWVGDDDQQDKFRDNRAQLLLHLAIVTGKKFSDPDDVYFTCAC